MHPRRLFTDQMGRVVAVHFPPQRIVSLVPSQTELLYDLGLDDRVVGITKYCVHPPEWFRTKTRVGGTKQIHLDRVAALQPDLLIGNKEENTQEQVLALAERFPVWLSDVQTLPDALAMIQAVGQITNTEPQAFEWAARIERAFGQLAAQMASQPKRRAAYLIWRKPWMVAASSTFIHEMMTLGGWENVFASLKRYPEVSEVQLAQAQPDYVLLSSEPYPFAEKHVVEIQALCPQARVLLVNGEMFSWYGSRLLRAAEYLGMLLQEAVR